VLISTDSLIGYRNGSRAWFKTVFVLDSLLPGYPRNRRNRWILQGKLTLSPVFFSSFLNLDGLNLKGVLAEMVSLVPLFVGCFLLDTLSLKLGMTNFNTTWGY